MRQPTMTLKDVELVLKAQDRQLRAAYESLTQESRGRPVALPVAALERLRELCTREATPKTAMNLRPGIRG